MESDPALVSDAVITDIDEEVTDNTALVLDDKLSVLEEIIDHCQMRVEQLSKG